MREPFSTSLVPARRQQTISKNDSRTASPHSSPQRQRGGWPVHSRCTGNAPPMHRAGGSLANPPWRFVMAWQMDFETGLIEDGDRIVGSVGKGTKGNVVVYSI